MSPAPLGEQRAEKFRFQHPAKAKTPPLGGVFWVSWGSLVVNQRG